ncbi:Uncharacterised protein [Campylobacter hyointestinalis subsp. hyointestinalis]|uniref:Uncharacterized protein n=1 Tax=Campylobacter hyointestinalis subsp. hyointestinalis TaxID=91352 RepID=A0A0S4SRH4_CAMHY|nr:hypothetical protein [Campylobacter hyointestinalis]CUU88205.1 Uncharacterised protein [Campylobacter hyointestinalis subsp. hyointestinalis]
MARGLIDIFKDYRRNKQKEKIQKELGIEPSCKLLYEMRIYLGKKILRELR